MFKVATGIAFIWLLGIICFTMFKANQPVSLPALSSKNAVGEKRRGDFPVIELKRQKIEAKTVFRFESKNNDESYELDEDQLNLFAQSLNSINSGELGKIENYQSIEDKDLYRKEIENREERYYQYDHEL